MFKKILQEIVESVDGGTGAALMGYDGIAVAQYYRESSHEDLQLVAAEFANVLKEIRKSAELLEAGDMEEVMIRTASLQVLIKALDDDYFTVLLLSLKGNSGKGRYLLKRHTYQLLEALK